MKDRDMFGSSMTQREKKASERENVFGATRTMREREAMRKQPERNTRKEKR